jgi:hypothetical protein
MIDEVDIQPIRQRGATDASVWAVTRAGEGQTSGGNSVSNTMSSKSSTGDDGSGEGVEGETDMVPTTTNNGDTTAAGNSSSKTNIVSMSNTRTRATTTGSAGGGSKRYSMFHYPDYHLRGRGNTGLQGDLSMTDNPNSSHGNRSCIEVLQYHCTTSGEALNTMMDYAHTLQHTRLAYLLIRALCGANLRPSGRDYGQYLRKIYSFFIILLCILELLCIPLLYTFGKIVLCNAYDGDTNCDDKASLPYLLSITMCMPFALVYTPIAGIIIFSSSGMKTSYLKVFAAMVRVSFVNIILLTSYFLAFVSADLSVNDRNSSPPNVTQDLIVFYQCSHMALLLFTDQYIAFVERIRWTRGWDGLTTSLFVTQDNRKEYVDAQSIGEEDLWIL